LNISRIKLPDILVLIADIPTLQIQHFLSNTVILSGAQKDRFLVEVFVATKLILLKIQNKTPGIIQP
jgi:hypothetical protein